MSRHQAFRNVQSTVSEHLYDDDDYYSDEAEELGEEDKALLEQGTADVRAALGVEADKVTTEQIQEALWHYYYDVDKSVTYLLTKFIAPPPPKTAKSAQKPQPGKHIFPCSAIVASRPVSRFGLGECAHSNPKSGHSWICGQWSGRACRRPCGLRHLHGHGFVGNGSSLTSSQGDEPLPPTFDVTKRNTNDLSALFSDMPWGNIPQERVAIFIEPQRPRGGLLGGSGAAPKLTKLQQLALARKKKLEQQQSSEEQTEGARQKLGELSVKEAPSLKENRLPEGGGFSKRQKLSETEAAGRMLKTGPAATKTEKGPTVTQRRSDPQDSMGQARMAMDGAEEDEAPEPESRTVPSEAPSGASPIEPSPAPEMAKPSAFAQTLFGSSAVEPELPATKFFALPYMAYCPSLADAFSKPSPDDVVLAAQAKGSITGKGKN